MSSSLEFNKLAAAVLSAGIVFMASGFAADFLYNKGHEEGEEGERAYPIAAVESGAEEATEAAEAGPAIDPVTPLLAAADPAKGEKTFKKCASCHSVDKGGPDKIGPNLWGIVGNQRASNAAFSYSDALQGMSGETWDYEALNEFLYKPKDYAPGTKMSFGGLKKVSQRADLIAFLRQQSDSPVALPE